MAVGDSGLQALSLNQMLDRFAELAAAEVILGNYKFDAAVQIKERAASATFTAAYGQVWVKNTVPAELWFADDAGAESQVMLGAGAEVNDLSAAVTWANVPQANIPDPLLQANGSAGAPSYSFASAPTDGFYSGGTQRILIATNGAELARFSSTGTPHGLQFAGTGKPLLYNVLSTATQPTLVAYGSDPNTGIGGTSPDRLSLIAGGIEGLAVREVLNGIQFSPAADIAITALAGGGSGGAGILKQSYNLITVAASTGDSVTLPVSFLVNTLIHIVNAGANAVDVFPGSGDDLGAGADTAVSLAAGDGITYIGTVLNTTWAPYTMAAASAPHPDPHLLGDGSISAPTYSFSGETNTGIFFGSTFMQIDVKGVARWEFQDGFLQGAASNSPAMANETTTATNPTLLPNQNTFNTGIGSAGSDQLSLIAGSIEGLRLTELNNGIVQAPAANISVTALAGGGQGGAGILIHSYNLVDVVATTGDSVTLPATFAVNSLIHIVNTGANAADVFPGSGDDLGAGADTAITLAAGDGVTYIATTANTTWANFQTTTAAAAQADPLFISDGTAGAPALAFTDDPTTGIYSSGANRVTISISGAAKFGFRGDNFESLAGNSPIIKAETASATNPTLIPNGADDSTGIGAAANSAVTTVSLGVEALTIGPAFGGGVLQSHAADVALTAFATGGIASATLLKQSYNVITTCATAGDSVKMPVTYRVNTIIHIKNSGAASCDVFPNNVSDDLGAGGGTAIALPAGASVSYIATVANSTWTVLQTLSGTKQILLDDGTSSLPSYSFADDPDTGMYTSFDGVLAFAAAGVEGWKMTGTVLSGFVGNGPALRNEAATVTNPTLTPHVGDPGTGIGAEAAKPSNLSLIASGVEGIRIKNEAGIDSIVIHPGFIPNDPVTPSLAFGDGDSGWYESADDTLSLSLVGAKRFDFLLNQILGESGTAALPTYSFAGDPDTGMYTNSGDALMFATDGVRRFLITTTQFQGSTSGSGGIIDQASGFTTPTILQNSTDVDSGLGGDGSDTMSLIVGGVEGLRLSEASSGVLQAVSASLAITARAGGGVGAPILVDSYNAISVVATTGDSVTMPAVFAVNTIIHIKNNGANSADVTPATGDDLGQGTNTVEALAAGRSTSYIATTANATWTNMRPLLTTAADPLLLADGTVGAPSFAFTDDVDTGIFTVGDDILSLTAGGLELLQLIQGAGISQVVISPGAVINDEVTPVLAFGDGNTGFYESADNVLHVSIAGNSDFIWTAGVFGADQAAGPAMLNLDASSTVPTLVPNQADPDTGLGRGGVDRLNLLAGGVTCMSVEETGGSTPQIGFYATAPISLQTGVAVTEAGIHAALVALGLITGP